MWNGDGRNRILEMCILYVISRFIINVTTTNSANLTFFQKFYESDLFIKSLLLNDIHHFDATAGLSTYTLATNLAAISCLN